MIEFIGELFHQFTARKLHRLFPTMVLLDVMDVMSHQFRTYPHLSSFNPWNTLSFHIFDIDWRKSPQLKSLTVPQSSDHFLLPLAVKFDPWEKAKLTVNQGLISYFSFIYRFKNKLNKIKTFLDSSFQVSTKERSVTRVLTGSYLTLVDAIISFGLWRASRYFFPFYINPTRVPLGTHH